MPTANGYQIKSATTGQCLVVQDAGIGNGVSVVQQGCSTAPNALFRLRKLDDWFEIVATHSSKCISPSGGGDGRASGLAMVQWACDMADPQRWTILGAEGRAPSAWTSPRNIGIVPVAGTVSAERQATILGRRTARQLQQRNQHLDDALRPHHRPSDGFERHQTGSDMFCPGTNILPDGRILVTGGITAASRRSTTLHERLVARRQHEHHPRLQREHHPLERRFVYLWRLVVRRRRGKDAEIWSSSTNKWRVLRNVKGNDAADPSVAVYPGDTHYWLFAGSNGSVFHAGPARGCIGSPRAATVAFDTWATVERMRSP